MITLAGLAGITEDMDEEVYHADPVPGGSLSSTWARKIIRPAGPAKFRHEQDSPKVYKKVFDEGHIAHGMVLGTGSVPVVIPSEKLSKSGSTGTNAANEFIEQARAAGKIPVKQVDYDRIAAMAAALEKNPEAVIALRGRRGEARHEVSAFRQDHETGMWLRCRIDSLHEEGITDYKTCVDADPVKFARKTCMELGYHMQGGWYLDQMIALREVPPEGTATFVLQEKTAPYLVSVVDLSALYLHLGRESNRRAIDLYAKCRKTDTWPGYVGRPVVDPPRWATNEEDEVLASEVDAELKAYADSLTNEGKLL